jgi:(2Fe-2S) ferredoxin
MAIRGRREPGRAASERDGKETMGDGKVGTKIARGAKRKAERLGLASIERHVFLCCDTEETGCASSKRMVRSWNHLKKRLKDLGLSESGRIYRTKTHCMRICASGPIAVVYPDGVWYGRCDPPVIDRIIDEHLVGGKVVKEYVLETSGPFGPPASASEGKKDKPRKTEKKSSKAKRKHGR